MTLHTVYVATMRTHGVDHTFELTASSLTSLRIQEIALSAWADVTYEEQRVEKVQPPR